MIDYIVDEYNIDTLTPCEQVGSILKSYEGNDGGSPSSQDAAWASCSATADPRAWLASSELPPLTLPCPANLRTLSSSSSGARLNRRHRRRWVTSGTSSGGSVVV